MAQTSEQVVEPEAQVETTEPQFPELLPGYYTETFTFRSIATDFDMPTKWGGATNRGATFPTQTAQICHTGEDLQRASDALWRGMPGSDECRVVAATLVGTHGEGEIICGDAQMRMVIRYTGEFTETSARFSIFAEARSKSRFGGMTLKADFSSERIAETCTEDIEEGEGDAAAAASEAATKM